MYAMAFIHPHTEIKKINFSLHDVKASDEIGDTAPQVDVDTRINKKKNSQIFDCILDRFSFYLFAADENPPKSHTCNLFV
jgi:rRNA maturation protein Rpf1